MKQPPNWNTEEIEKLKTLAGTMSSSKIGKLLGRTKDAVKNKIIFLDLPRFAITFEVHQKKAPAPKEPMMALYKNHAAEARRLLPRLMAPTKIEWCPECHSPVSNWAEHEERQGHRRA